MLGLFIEKYHSMAPKQRFGMIAIVSFLLLFGIGLSTRQWVVEKYVHRKLSYLNKRYDADFVIGEISFSGLTGIKLRNISVQPRNGSSLFFLGEISVKVRLFPLFRGKIGVKSIDAKDLKITIQRDSTAWNYAFLFRKDSTVLDTLRKEDVKGIAQRTFGFAEALFLKLPASASCENIQVTLSDSVFSSVFTVPKLQIEDGNFKTEIFTQDSIQNNSLTCQGTVNPDDRQLQISFHRNQSQTFSIPWLKHRFGLRFEFDSLHFSFNRNDLETDTFITQGKVSVAGLRINHWRISDSTVVLNRGALDFKLNLGNQFIELDSASQISYNQISFNPWLKYQFKPSKQLSLHLHKSQFDAQDFFASLPLGLFRSLEGMKTTGKLSFDLDFNVDLTKIDSLWFDVGMKRHNFKIVKFGRTNLTKINEPFEYTAYSNNGPVRTFTLGEGIGNYTILSEISPLLQNSVLTGEDPGFFNHRGFILDAIRESIATDIKEKRFARGGSTISMQMVKNIYLNRHKNIARKIEEILLTWIIENNGLTTKEKMFEVYLNAIEWGNNIYGIREAADFYYNKKPSKLSLPESLFLAYLVPHPSWFRFSFTSEQKLKPNIIAYFNLLSGKMVQRGLASPSDTVAMAAKFKLSQAALLQLKPLAKDTLQTEIDFLE